MADSTAPPTPETPVAQVPAEPTTDVTARPRIEAGGFDPFIPWKGSTGSMSTNVTVDSSGQSVPTNKTDNFVVVSPNEGNFADYYKIAREDQAKQQPGTNNLLLENVAKRYNKEIKDITLEDFSNYLLSNTDEAVALTTPDANNNFTQFSAGGTLQGSTRNKALSKELKFNIVTGRTAYESQVESYFGTNFVVTERGPLEFIKFLSQQEPWPTIVFADSRTGEYWYVVRGLDVSGLGDGSRFNRTYYFRQYPEGVAPHMATMLHSFREERSAISKRTNIIVQSHAISDSNGEKNNLIHLSIIPPGWRDRAFACSYFTVTDDTAVDSPGALIAVAFAYARVLSKEVKAAAATMLGDPSIIPGEAIQVIGSPMHQGYTDPDKGAADREVFMEMAQAYEDTYKRMADLVRSDASGTAGASAADNEGNFLQNMLGTAANALGFGNGSGSDAAGGGGGGGKSPVDLKIANNANGGPVVFETTQNATDMPEVLTLAAQERQQLYRNTIMFEPEPNSMWRVEGVVDRFNDGTEGYYTELTLLSCF
jgi:hypothetical protein